MHPSKTGSAIEKMGRQRPRLLRRNAARCEPTV